MRTYVFCGSAPSTMLGVFEAKRFGQAIDLTDEQARDASLGGCAIAPAEELPEMLSGPVAVKHREFGTHATGSQEFHALRKQALLAAHDFRESLEATEGVTVNG